MGDSHVTGKRRSRFESGSIQTEEEPLQKRINVDISLAAAKAAEISKELTSKIALVSSLLGSSKSSTEKKPAYRPLLLDSQGREIDEFGNVIKQDIAPVKTLVANVAATNANKKKENPYLSHRTVGTSNLELETPSSDAAIIVDDRIRFKKRETKAKRALSFAEAGQYLKEAAKLQEKEDRKIIAGYSSGRKALQQDHLGDDEEEKVPVEAEPQDGIPQPKSIPPICDSILPTIEWWDELFLPKSRREQRKISKAASLESEDIKLLSLFHNKTYKYIQHPVPVKPLLVDKPLTTLPMYLTKQERKKLRKSIRQERERNKRDQMMLGLLPAPEPKFKLNNFMKILGDQAVADPSKIELKVIQQVQKRILNHEMRNLANKLTPKERKEKKIKKLNEDLSKGCHVAVFRVTNFSCLKYRFKVDVNAQQLFLSGLVLLCPEDGLNLVVAEGGPKGIRKFVHLMTKRIKWNVEIANNPLHTELEYKVVQEGDSWNYLMNVPGMSEVLRENEVDKHSNDENDTANDDENDTESSSDESDENNSMIDDPEEGIHTSAEDVKPESIGDVSNRRCDLLWQGVIPKRIFTGFKFQESKSSMLARKFLESKNLSHYWDMVENADVIASSSADIDSFF